MSQCGQFGKPSIIYGVWLGKLSAWGLILAKMKQQIPLCKLIAKPILPFQHFFKLKTPPFILAPFPVMSFNK